MLQMLFGYRHYAHRKCPISFKNKQPNISVNLYWNCTPFNFTDNKQHYKVHLSALLPKRNSIFHCAFILRLSVSWSEKEIELLCLILMYFIFHIHIVSWRDPLLIIHNNSLSTNKHIQIFLCLGLGYLRFFIVLLTYSSPKYSTWVPYWHPNIRHTRKPLM